jgi:hypothetical protein
MAMAVCVRNEEERRGDGLGGGYGEATAMNGENRLLRYR